MWDAWNVRKVWSILNMCNEWNEYSIGARNYFIAETAKVARYALSCTSQIANMIPFEMKPSLGILNHKNVALVK